MSRTVFKTCLIIIGIFLLFANILFCNKKITNPNAGPSPPKLLPPPDEMMVVEKGVDAIPELDAIQIDWEKSNDKTVEYFLLYRKADNEQQFSQLKRLGKNDTSWVDGKDIQIFLRYFYYICAIDKDDRQGAPSDTVDYMLIDKVYNLSATWEPQPTFRWQIHPYNVNEYVIKVFDANTGEKIWFASVFSDYTDLDEEIKFNFDNTAKFDSLQSGRRYSWRVDTVGPERNSGSESKWHQFSAP